MSKKYFGNISLIGKSTKYPETFTHKILRRLNNFVRYFNKRSLKGHNYLTPKPYNEKGNGKGLY